MKVYIKVVYRKYYAEFYHRMGGGWQTTPFYTCGNAGIGEEFASALELLGHKVVAETIDDDEEEL